MINNLQINEELCGELWPFIQDENVTDIKWNGSALWIDDLNKGRYMLKDDEGNPKRLETKFLEIFCSKVANANNVSFNYSNPSLMAETPELRIQAQHPHITGDSTINLAIRKTPAVSRLANQDLKATEYADEIILNLLPCLIRARLSGIVTGDVGSGKTELQKWMIGFIPLVDGIYTVEDTLEIKAKVLYPEKDIISIKYNDKYTEEQAIKDCLRLMCKWLILAEARGKDIAKVLEGASTGCTALCTIHSENTWDVPDRIMNMIGDDAKFNTKNDVYTFFSYAIKVSKHITENRITRNIEQLSFFTREFGINKTINFLVDGKLTGEKIPEMILNKFKHSNELGEYEKYEQVFFNTYNERMKEFEQKEGNNG